MDQVDREVVMPKQSVLVGGMVASVRCSHVGTKLLFLLKASLRVSGRHRTMEDGVDEERASGPWSFTTLRTCLLLEISRPTLLGSCALRWIRYAGTCFTFGLLTC